MVVELIDRCKRERIRELWSLLAGKAPPCYFLSSGWVETWLDLLEPTIRVDLVVVWGERGPLLAFFLGSRRLRRHGFVRSHALYFNQTGWQEPDDLCIEFSSWVPAHACLPIEQLLDQLPGDWDELVLPALDATSMPARLLGRSLAGYRVRIEREVIAPAVDLDRVRSAPDYLTLLGPNTRAQIRRTQREYATRGPLRLEVAESLPQALGIFDQLVGLHARAWARRGERGAFSPFLLAFHRRLIETRFATGEIQLLRLCAGREVVGCLYNFVWQKAVLFYQSGLLYPDDPRLKPGLLCHAEAVRYNAALGHRRYDFLGGSARYKQCLSTDCGRLIWVRVEKPRWRFSVEDRLRQARGWLLGLVGRSLRPSREGRQESSGLNTSGAHSSLWPAARQDPVHR